MSIRRVKDVALNEDYADDDDYEDYDGEAEGDEAANGMRNDSSWPQTKLTSMPGLSPEDQGA
jgi:hypothetical protein